MLPVYICEDTKTQLQYITKIIKDTILIEELDAELVCAVSSPYDLIAHLKENTTPSLYFLDVELNCDMDGFALAKEIRRLDPRGFIVFITAHTELSSLAFKYKLEAMDYILKDCPDTIHNDVHSCLLKAMELYTSPANTMQQTIALKLEGKVVTFLLPDIYCIETSHEAHKIQIHQQNGYTEFFYSLKEISKLLNDDFFQCHKSCIINLRHIQEINKKDFTVTLSNGKVCPVSTRLIRNLMSIFFSE